MSGEKCFEILDKIFVAKNKQKIEEIKGYTIKYGHIVDKKDVIDEVLVSYFKAPKSYTAENMCEINSHGGNVIVKKILELCLKNGAVLAEPGEFTKRAFLNGRIDLLQAESVIDLINAKSERENAKNKLLEAEKSIEHIDKDIQDRLNEASQRGDGIAKQILTNAEEQVKLIEKNISRVINAEEKTLSAKMTTKTLNE